MLSFKQSVSLNGKEFLCLICGTGANGVDFFAYIKTDLTSYKKMHQDFDSQKSGVNFFEYGEIMERGFGHTPPDEVKAKMEIEYSFTHDSESA